jgi:hypothetical protein
MRRKFEGMADSHADQERYARSRDARAAVPRLASQRTLSLDVGLQRLEKAPRKIS